MSLDARFQKPFTLPAGLRSFTFSSLVQRAQEQKEALAQSSNGVAAVGGSAVVQGATRFVMVSNLTYATGHAEVVYLLLQRDADPSVIVRWEHTSALRTDFVCELSTVEAATKACHHVNSFGRFERRPKTKYLASYNFVMYNGDSAQPQGEDGAAPSASPPSAPWENYSRGVATAFGGTGTDWSLTPDGIPFTILTSHREGRGSRVDTSNQAAIDAALAALPSRKRSDHTWLNTPKAAPTGGRR